MKFRNLRLSLKKGPWGFWIWLGVSNWLFSGCLQTLNVTKSEQQQLDKELLRCLLSCC